MNHYNMKFTFKSIESKGHIVAGTKKGTSYERILLEIGWQLLSTRRFIAKGIKMFQIKNGDSPDYLDQILRQFLPHGVSMLQVYQQVNL